MMSTLTFRDDSAAESEESVEVSRTRRRAVKMGLLGRAVQVDAW